MAEETKENDYVEATGDDLVVEGEAGVRLHEEYVWYPGVLRRIEKGTGQYGPQFKWVALLDEDLGKGKDGEDRETFFWTDQRITPHEKNKGGKYYTALTGKPVVPGEPVDLRPLIGARIQVMFEVDKKAGKDKVFAVKPEA